MANKKGKSKATKPMSVPGHGLADVYTDEDMILNPDEKYSEYKKHSGIKRYNKAMSVVYPYRSKPKHKESYSPLDYHGFFNFFTLRFLNPVFYHKGKFLHREDLYPHSPLDTSYHNGLRFAELWDEEVEKKGLDAASMGWVCFRFIRTRWIIMISSLLAVLFGLLFITSFLTQRLLQYTEQEEENLGYGLGLAFGCLLTNIFRVVGDKFFFVTACRTATRLRVGVLSIVFKKLARLRSLQDKGIGEMVNICANDSQRIFDVTVFGNYLIAALVLIVAIIVVSYFILGWAAVIGILGTFVMFWPLQAMFGRIQSLLRQKCIVVTDQRVQKMNEVLSYIKLIKMYAWEIPFSKTVGAIRSKERGYLEKAGYTQSFSISITPINPNIATVFTILVHLALGNSLTATEAFTLVAVLNTLRAVMGATPWSIRAIAEGRVALVRLKSILFMEDMCKLDILPENKTYDLIIRNATFAWDKIEKLDEDQELYKFEQSDNEKDAAKRMFANFRGKITAKDINIDTPEVDDLLKRGKRYPKNPYDKEMVMPTLFDINFALRKGRLTGICGGVGSGKSTLIASILGQLHTLEGSCMSQGKFAYAAQEAWLFNDTLKENILFGKPYDEEKYDRCIAACCLGPDLEILPYGDQTEIGERGLNMSGGQKQRISLARALYSDRDIYLLDDPLSAVDAHVGKHIFEECISKCMKGKTVLFVTHQLQYLKDCDLIVTMIDGRIAETGTHDELMAKDEVYSILVKTFHQKQEGGDDFEEAIEADETPIERKERALSEMSGRSRASSVLSEILPDAADEIENTGGKLTQDEKGSMDTVSMETYLDYMQSMGGYHMAALVLSFFLIMFATMTFNNVWLSFWLNKGSGGVGNTTEEFDDISLHPDLLFYELVYLGSLLLIVVFGAIKSFVFMKLTMRASTHMHDTVFMKVIRSPMSFFDTTPTGRVLNRFSKDLDEVDVLLPLNLEISIQTSLMILFSFIIICAVFPWLTIMVVPILIMIGYIISVYRAGIRDLKRIENLTRSPWFSHITATVSGLASIHAYEKTDDFIKRFCNLMDNNSLPYMLFRMSARWSGIRMEILVIFLQFATALMVVLQHGEINSSSAGLALSYTIQITGMFQLLVLMASETEARFTSVERIQSYMKTLTSEAPPRIKGRVPKKDWPQKGVLKFKRYSMRYRTGLPLVIKSVSFTINSCEKIGIVGRTGSGKSSLGIALFRLVEPAGGEIIIDDIVCSEIGLRDLRSKLSIIPQDPVLFFGTVRYNLDPFEEHSDKAIWEALERSYMRERISGMDNQLEALVAEGGDNFSVGERQLLCMARALLRNSKLLLLDEATAAIDTETDSLIQHTIRTEFKDCTMLIIAHRLNTILDADRVMVMDDGRLVEFDTPANLLAKTNGIFAGMVAATEAASNQ